MNLLKKAPFIVRIILLTTVLSLLVGVTIILTNVMIQQNILTNEMKKQAELIAEHWGKEIDIPLVEEAQKSQDFHSTSQQELTAFFDSLSETNPNVAQGYIFGTELRNGNETSIIGNPSHIVSFLEENNVTVGDFHTQPATIVKAIEELKETGDITYSSIYEDEFGTWITVLYPIKNNAGETFAFFGVDVDASMVKNGKDQLVLYSLLIMFPIIVAIVLVQVFVIRKSSKPLKDLLQGINEMKNGNLDISLPTREDDLGQMNAAFNEMAFEMKTMIEQIKSTATTAHSFANTITDVADDSKIKAEKISTDLRKMKDALSSQEIAITESAGAIEQVTAEIQTIALSSQDVSNLTKNMEQHASEGAQALNEMTSQMETITENVLSSREIVQSLRNHSLQISSILKLITEIAEQTNLLSLNAAIEAARAGEQGKGFSVVAQEVRKLAEQSNQSTGKIEKIIEQIQTEIEEAVQSMEIGTTETKKGQQLVFKANELFHQLKQTSNEIANQIESVSAGSQEISAASEEVSASVQELSTIAEMNTSISEDIETSAREQFEMAQRLAESAVKLNKLSENLKISVERFDVS
ncbi:methyl-accepting chemotaxis protein [Bacillus kexueae]|uniref:methyl-accepting chemotaxis protein n=1 Tax=Aeribacillus kexueae TaxID=2078952 RepID=UPI001FAF7009